MGFPSVYRKNQGNAVASYDYFDLASGAGIYELYLGFATNYIISDYRFNSSIIYTQATSADATTLLGSYDFDLMINKAMTIRGRMIISIPVFIAEASSSTWFTVNVQTWDGTTETTIATGGTTHANPSNTYARSLGDITIPTTRLKAGQYLRINLLWYGNGGDNSVVMRFAHDPSQSTDAIWASTTVSSDAIVYLPVQIYTE